jgi:hypothetical protein
LILVCWGNIPLLSMMSKISLDKKPPHIYLCRQIAPGCTSPFSAFFSHNRLPAGSAYIPAKPEYIPAKPEYIPAESEYIPAESEYIPPEPEYIPAESEYIPAGSEYIPPESEYIPPGTEYLFHHKRGGPHGQES